AEFKKAIEIEPSAECYFHIGECYWENEQDKNAIKYFNLAAEKADVDLLLTMAVTCAQGGETKHFNRYIEKALLLDPTYPLPYAVRAMTKLMTDPISLLLNPNLLQGAIKDLREAERLAENDPRFSSLLPELREARRTLENPPRDLTDLFSLGPPPFDFAFEDEDEEEEESFDFFEPR